LKNQKGEAFFAFVPPADAKTCNVHTNAQDKQFSYQTMKCLSDAGIRIAAGDPAEMWHTNPLEGSSR
jgi:hypothetical protein